MVRLNRRSRVCPGGFASFGVWACWSPFTQTAPTPAGPVGGRWGPCVAGWNTKYRFMLNEKRAGPSSGGSAGWARCWVLRRHPWWGVFLVAAPGCFF
jgi:hypothetical protein